MPVRSSALPSQAVQISAQHFSLVESLEDRIAPATITAGALGGTPPSDAVNYTQGQSPGGTTPFVLASASPDASIAALFAGSADHYYLNLSAKDALRIYNTGGGASPFITLNAGNAIAFFYDANNNDLVEANELSGLSLSSGADIIVAGSINGDVLVNLSSTGAFSSTALTDDAKGIKAISVGGTIDGSILSGGVISKATVNGGVEIIGTGTAANNYAYDLGGGTGAGDGTLGVFVPAAKKAGPNINNVQAGNVDAIIAGAGGIGAAGGAIVNVTLNSDVDGLLIQGGLGGDGGAGALKGGVGGKISNVVIYGVQDASLNSTITISGGDGGAGSGTGAGGVGGTVDKIYIGYEYQSPGKLAKSPNFLTDFVYVNGGDGGSGKTAGNGGALTNINVRVAPTDLAPMGAEVGLNGGDGGASTVAGGKAGNGGAVTSYFIVSNYDGAVDPLAGVSVIGGDGGDATAGATGGNGGSVSSGVILSKVLSVSAGNGADGGKTGGLGGSINTLEIAFPGDSKLVQFNQAETNIGDIFAEQVTLNAGTGGDGLATGSKGGNGGNILSVAAPDTNLSVLQINSGSAANGGAGNGGTGGNGGLLSNLRFESDRDTTNEVAAVIRSGNGGDGGKKAGVGGGITTSGFILTDASIAVSSGNGGNSTAGTAGDGGTVKTLTATVFGLVGGGPGIASLTSGSGGTVTTGKGKAGNGGNIQNATVLSLGNASMMSGAGGAADTGTSGNGGTITNAAVIGADFMSSATLTAGNAGGGNAPTKGGLGGSITSATTLGNFVQGGLDITVQAGNGSFGGAGGDIKSLSVTGLPSGSAPSGDILVAAGNGSSGAKTAGKGGSLISITSFTSSDVAAGALFTAGTGGASSGAGGAGGSITTLTILGGASEYSVQAGDGGNSTAKGLGGLGGSVSNLSSLPDVLLLNLAAGNGGNSATGKGGVGGSVSNVHVEGDIGVRFGVNFGYGAMGGIFAGAGGTGTTAGASGNVLMVSADAIASIVAGRDNTAPQLVSKAEGISLNGNEKLQTDANGGFLNIDTANFIGGISLADPTVANADQFKTNNGALTAAVNPWNPATTFPLDGLVAALVMSNVAPTNVGANAWLQQASPGTLQLVSLYNT